MKALWIRVDANIGGKDVVWKAAEFLGISAPQAVGHLVMFWGAVALHTDGAVAEKFDSQLETWAGWTGERGRFAAFVRDECLDRRGKIKRWDEMQGALEARRKNDRDRKRRANPLRNSTEIPRKLHGESEARNVTERNSTEQPKPSRAKKPREAPESWVVQITTAWRSKIGDVEEGRVGKRLKRVVESHGVADTIAGIGEYEFATRGKARKLEWFAEDANRYIEGAKEPLVDPATGWFTAKAQAWYDSLPTS